MAPVQSHRSLASLLKGVRFSLARSQDSIRITEQMVAEVTADSRQADSGSLFVAVKGLEFDGHDFIDEAVRRGCSVVVCEAGKKPVHELRKLEATVVEVEDTAGAYAIVAANYFSRPAEDMQFIGVTGTNGKTTVTYLLEHVLLEAGYNVGVIGTTANRYTCRGTKRKNVPAQFTTPEAMQLQELLREMADSDVDYVIMEVSSHGIVQSRVDTLSFDAAAFTNLSRDHLDYHSGMDEYFNSKMRLFTDHMKDGGTVVLPQVEVGAKSWERVEALHDACRLAGNRIISWGRGGGASIDFLSVTPSLESTEVIFNTATGRHRILSPLVGFYNAENLLTAYGLSLAVGIEEHLICRALSTANGAPGRVERIKGGTERPVVLVDYAHTPDALEKVLGTVAALPHQRLFSVFGCGGNRDKGKRRLMGEIGARLSDVAIVTDDNPRNEDPDEIVRQILAGVAFGEEQVKPAEWLEESNSSGRGVVVIRDRQKAIQSAIKAASAGDIVVIAGKGHEPYQVTMEGKRFFDDRIEAQRTLCSWTAEQVCSAVGGKVIEGEASSKLLGEVITDSRIESRESIFVALRGETHDAHRFAPQAFEKGASCLVVEKKIDFQSPAPCQVMVKDSLRALGDLAAYHRRKLSGLRKQVVIGLTGSCGKTTVKEMTAAILERKWQAGTDYPDNCVLKTKGNFNNLIGLPLSLLPLDVHHRAAVMEMGMNQPGELLRLGEIADPDISCITNIHGAHLEGLQSIEGVARAKEELFAVTKSSGTLVVNLDDSLVKKAASAYPHDKITYSTSAGGSGEGADLWASEIELKQDGTTAFTMHHEEDTVRISLSIAGEHNVSNALCAAAISFAAGADLGQVQAGLADFRPPDKRMELVQVRAGFALLNDTYNANPASMAAGLRTLRQMAKRRSVAIIGDMLELGSAAKDGHYNVGKLLAELTIDYAGVVGEFRNTVLQGALDHGFDRQRVRAFDEKDDAARWIKDLVHEEKLGQDDVVLVKASRGLRFETIVEKITE
ncbi:MAG: UDP-N-acetylmuramoyl-L-alanyl-D-glutamate--2,6-diaminopimelate ligase [Desulforhopalus sp.]